MIASEDQRKYNLRLEISNQRHDQKKVYEAYQMYNAQLKGISKKIYSSYQAATKVWYEWICF